MAPLRASGQVQDPIALAEIELCGDLMIAASSADVDRLSLASIDEVLRVGRACRAGDDLRAGR